MQGEVTENLPDAMFRVRLENGDRWFSDTSREERGGTASAFFPATRSLCNWRPTTWRRPGSFSGPGNQETGVTKWEFRLR